MKYTINSYTCNTCFYTQDFEGTDCPNRRCDGTLNKTTDKVTLTVRDKADVENETKQVIDQSKDQTEKDVLKTVKLTQAEQNDRKAKINAENKRIVELGGKPT